MILLTLLTSIFAGIMNNSLFVKLRLGFLTEWPILAENKTNMRLKWRYCMQTPIDFNLFTIKFNRKGPHCFGIGGYRSATQERLRSTGLSNRHERQTWILSISRAFL